jgi:hypothetical protein
MFSHTLPTDAMDLTKIINRGDHHERNSARRTEVTPPDARAKDREGSTATSTNHDDASIPGKVPTALLIPLLGSKPFPTGRHCRAGQRGTCASRHYYSATQKNQRP